MEKTVTRVMQLFSTEYKGFIGNDSKRIALWCDRLQGIKPDAIYRAAMELLDDELDYPPNIGKLKRKALLNDNKHLSVTASMAWGRVLLKIKNPKATLTALEQRALDCTCDIYSLRQKNVNDLSYDRTFFIRHYEEIRNIEVKKIVATPQVDNLLEGGDVKRLEGER